MGDSSKPGLRLLPPYGTGVRGQRDEFKKTTKDFACAAMEAPGNERLRYCHGLELCDGAIFLVETGRMRVLPFFLPSLFPSEDHRGGEE
jgi:hypothetical protein